MENIVSERSPISLVLTHSVQNETCHWNWNKGLGLTGNASFSTWQMMLRKITRTAEYLCLLSFGRNLDARIKASLSITLATASRLLVIFFRISSCSSLARLILRRLFVAYQLKVASIFRFWCASDKTSYILLCALRDKKKRPDRPV